MAARAPVVQRQLRRPSLIASVFGGALRLLSMLVLALCFSIVLEWIGMSFWWPGQGVHHSERMLAEEVRYLNSGLTNSIVTLAPAELAQAAAARSEGILEFLGVDRLARWLNSPVPTAGWSAGFHDLARGSGIYVEAMVNTVQTFSVRVIVLLFATPVFLLFGFVGLAEGLMRRDLRRWGGGRESSFLYHHSKKFLAPSIVAAWMLYLAMPFSVQPNLVVLPFAVLFAVGMALTTGTFKKYL
jgi:integrating conjugative element membrane protein (TIGR03747 family)